MKTLFENYIATLRNKYQENEIEIKKLLKRIKNDNETICKKLKRNTI